MVGPNAAEFPRDRSSVASSREDIGATPIGALAPGIIDGILDLMAHLAETEPR